MKISAKGLLGALFLATLIPAQAFTVGFAPVGIPGGPDLPDSPYVLDYLVGRQGTFTVKRGSGALSASGSYVIKFTTNLLISVRGNSIIKDLSGLTWDYQLCYTNGVREGDYTFKHTAPLAGSFSNVLFATTNAPPVIIGTQAGSFYLTEKRLDMSQDVNPDILWERDDGHLGIWFMTNKINGTIMDSNLNKGFYLDSLYQATGHKTATGDWRVICQTDFDFNGMQDWVWQNTNSGQLRVWFLANTNFVDPKITNYNYHSYSTPIVSTHLNPSDFTVTTNITPTVITNYFIRTTTEVFSNYLSGPALVVTTYLGDSVSETNMLLGVLTTNITPFTITNLTTTTNNGITVVLTNIVTATNVTVTTNGLLDFTFTNVSWAEVSGRTVGFTNVISISDLAQSPDVTRVDTIGGYGVTNVFTYTNYPGFTRYFTNENTATFAELVGGFYLVTYTTNYNLTALTNFVNPFVREVPLIDQSPTDANTRLIGMADFDFDGAPDFLFRDVDGRLFYESYGESVAQAQSNPDRYVNDTPKPGWTPVGIVDLNNDGWPDILWQHDVKGTVAIWYMKGIFDAQKGYVYTHTGNGALNGGVSMPTWRICANADFNHDGQMDVLLRNTSTGQLIFWYLNGSKILKSSTIAGPVLPWQIVGPR